MQITRNDTATTPGPSDWFTGAVYLDPVAAPSGDSRLSASSVHFTPGARTAWHTHPNGQTIYVLEGVGFAQRRGGPIEVIRPGDRVFFEPGRTTGTARRRRASWPTSRCSSSTTRAMRRRGESTSRTRSTRLRRAVTEPVAGRPFGDWPSRPAHRPRR